MSKIIELHYTEDGVSIVFDSVIKSDGFFGKEGDNNKMFLTSGSALLTVDGFVFWEDLKLGIETPDNMSYDDINAEIEKYAETA